jgi:hypothetical protein
MIKKSAGLLVALAFSLGVSAQLKEHIPSMQSMKPKSDIVCYSKGEDQHVIIDAPEAYQNWRLNKSAKKSATVFEVEYVNFPVDAQVAFQKALDIWSTLIETPVPIRVLAVWQVIGDQSGNTQNILGGANPGTYIRDFSGAQQRLTWYPVALAEKMARKDLNSVDNPDIFAQFNSAFPNWYFGIDGIPQVGKTDFVTVVLHEIGHGLGITKGYNVSGDVGEISSFFAPLHVIYDHFIENSSDNNLVRNFVPPSATLKTQLTTAPLYFRTPQLNKTSASSDNRALLFSPNPFEAGSSLAHLDENFYNGSVNALMTPQVGSAEVIHNPGPVVLKMLADMGWVNTHIAHTRLPNTENVSTSYEVKAVLLADQAGGYNYQPGEVKLHYTTDGTNFTVLPMTATGNPNEFSASLPSTGSAITYGYYISVKDNLNRTIFNPGIYSKDGNPPTNLYYVFEAGPDNEKPEIDHTPKPFLLMSDTELKINANIADNIGILEAVVEYKINGADQTPKTMTLNAGSNFEYSTTITLPPLAEGDQIAYRIRVKDSSVAQNEALSPEAGYYTLNVVSLAATQDSYLNNFNAPSNDFFGDNVFSITTPPGFLNGAIHSTHPYPDGTGANFTSNFIYQLRIPIRLKAAQAIMKFDEIVLVEPGESGSEYGDDDFWDYVIVEGSKDGGSTWKPLVNGYDSRAQAIWLTRFNSSVDTSNPPNSTAVGDPALFRMRTINMLENKNFAAGDEIVIRFRLYTDQLVHGWGWAIDNLKIQIDDVPPAILHNHIDFVTTSAPTITITTKVTDDTAVDKLFIEYRINGGTIENIDLDVNSNVDTYSLQLNVTGLTAGDLIEYRIRCADPSGNESVLPATGFFKVVAVSFGTPAAQYIADFNSTNADFVGNFFSIAQPTGFSNGAIHSSHPYPNGFGLNNSTSNYIYLLTKPITVSATNPYVMFDEIAVVEYTGSAVKDLVVVEASKNNGASWETLVDPYAAFKEAAWKNAFDSGTNPTASHFQTRLFSLTGNGKFAAGDKILIRFRLTADGAINGWGWAIDNLSIQGPITGMEKERPASVRIYPNPVVQEQVTIEVPGGDMPRSASLQILDAQGRLMMNDQLHLTEAVNKKSYTISDWSAGMYYVRVQVEGTWATLRFIKSSR